MTIKLVQMKGVPKGDVMLLSSSYATDWTCYAEGENDGMKFKVGGTGATPTEAIDECHRRWLKITDAVPEIIGALPPPPAEEAHDADKWIAEPYPFHSHKVATDDDIPF